MEFQPVEVLKWVGIVLAAGFVGYFGRYLAMMILERVHRKNDASAPEPAREITGTPEKSPEEINLKLEKKRLKQEAKKAKKSKP